MRNVYRCLLFLCLQPALLIAQQPADRPPKPLVFTHVTVIDGATSPEESDLTIIIRGDRIAAIDRSADLPLPEGAQIVNGAGKFMIAGLGDMHAHRHEEPHLPLFTANGVTGIRQMAGLPYHHLWREQRERGRLLGPRQLIASMLIDGPKPVWRESIVVRNESEARGAIEK